MTRAHKECANKGMIRIFTNTDRRSLLTQCYTRPGFYRSHETSVVGLNKEISQFLIVNHTRNTCPRALRVLRSVFGSFIRKNEAGD